MINARRGRYSDQATALTLMLGPNGSVGIHDMPEMNPHLLEAGFDRKRTRVPWLGGRHLQLIFG